MSAAATIVVHCMALLILVKCASIALGPVFAGVGAAVGFAIAAHVSFALVCEKTLTISRPRGHISRRIRAQCDFGTRLERTDS